MKTPKSSNEMKPRIRLWRRIRDEHHHSKLVEITDPNQIGKNVLFVLPGSKTRHKNRKSIASYAKETERLLTKTASQKEADIIILSYESSKFALQQTSLTNAAVDYQRPDVEELTHQIFLPLLESGAQIALFGYSAGSILAENLRRSLILANKADQLPSIVSITIGNASVAPRLDVTEGEARPNFTSIVFQSLDDAVTQRRTQFEGMLPPNHRQGSLSINRLAGNGLLLTSHSAETTTFWKEDHFHVIKPTKGEEGHNKEFWTRRNAQTPSGVVLALERALGNAVKRKGLIKDVAELVTTGSEHRVVSQYSASAGLPLEALLLQVTSPQRNL